MITTKTKVNMICFHLFRFSGSAFLETIKTFLMEFCTQDGSGHKNFKYSNQLTKLAHREQVALYVDLDDVHDHDEELGKAIINNTRRYTNLVSEVVFDLLPNFVEHEIVAKDALDVYIEHRLMMEQRMRQPNEQRDARNKFPPELLRR